MVYSKNPWVEEEPLVPESSISQTWNNPDAYMAWNIVSPELEFCQWIQDDVAQLTTELPFMHVLETGMGGGYITRRVLDVLGPYDKMFQYTAFEGIVELVEYVPASVPICVKQGTPWGYDIRKADLIILDSSPKYRMDEIRNVALHGKSGAIVWVHDTHTDPWLNDMAKRVKKYLWPRCESYKWTSNPRGGFRGVLE